MRNGHYPFLNQAQKRAQKLLIIPLLALYSCSRPGSGLNPTTPMLGLLACQTARTGSCAKQPRFAFVSNLGASALAILPVASSTAGLLGSTSTMFVTNPTGLAVSADSSFLFSASSGGTITSYRINSLTGGLTQAGSLATGTALGSVVADPAGRFVFVASPANNSVWVLLVSSGGSLSVASSTGGLGSPTGLATDASGRFLFVTNQTGNSVSSYAINSGGTLTLIGTAAAGIGPDGVALDSSGTLLVAANSGASSLSPYRVDPGTGVLTSMTQAAAYGTPRQVGFIPGTRTVVVANNTSSLVSIHTESGGFLNLAGSTAVNSPYGVALAPSGYFALVTSNGGLYVTSVQLFSGQPAIAGTYPAAGVGPAFVTMASY